MSDPNGTIEIHQVGSVGPPTESPQWVALAGISAAASKLYDLLRMHGNEGVAADPETLALMLHADSADDLGPWLDELVQLGALSPTPTGYRLNITPPDGYTGPRDLDEWNARYDAGTPDGGAV